MRAVILANGDFPKKGQLVEELRSAEFLIVCDGAIVHLESLGILPDVIIGDLDSIPLELQKKYASQVVRISEQMSNDLSKAFYFCLNRGFDEFLILGATGKREDHTLGNISLLYEYAQQCKSIVMKSDYGEFEALRLPCKVSSQKGMQISLFCLNPQAKITSKNLKYPLNQLSLHLLANGTLNEAMGEEFELQSDRETWMIVYRALLEG